MTRVRTHTGFIYYYDTVRARHVPINTDMPSSELAEYAFNAYSEMMAIAKPADLRHYTKPAMVSAIW